MKKLLLFIFLIILFSCEKEDNDIHCWVCKVDSITSIQGIVVGSMSTFTYPCGITTENIFNHETDGTTTVTINLLQDGYIAINNITITSITNCKRK